MDGKTGLTTSATDGRTGATPLAPVVLQHQIQVGSHPSFNWEAWRAARRPGLWAPHPLCALVTSGASTASTTATLALAEKATQARVRPVRAKPGTSHGQGLRPMQAGRLCASAAPQANHANGDAPVLQVRGAQPESGRGWMAAARAGHTGTGYGLQGTEYSSNDDNNTHQRGTPCGKGMSTFVHVVIGDFALFILGRPRHLDEDIRIPLRPPRTDHRGERAVISAPRRHEGSQRQTQSLFQATGVAGIAKDQHGFHRAMTTRARTHSRPDVWTARAQGRHAVAAQHGQRWGHCGRGRDRPRCGTSCGRGHAYKPRSIAWYTG